MKAPSMVLKLVTAIYITLMTKVPIIKAMVFPVVRYGCKSWTLHKTECQGIDAFEL